MKFKNGANIFQNEEFHVHSMLWVARAPWPSHVSPEADSASVSSWRAYATDILRLFGVHVRIAGVEAEPLALRALKFALLRDSCVRANTFITQCVCVCVCCYRFCEFSVFSTRTPVLQMVDGPLLRGDNSC